MGGMTGRQELWVRALTDNFRLALSTFWGHRLRSLLTLLGIVIGAATVVSMMSLLEGLRNKVDEDLTGLGLGRRHFVESQNFGTTEFSYLDRFHFVLPLEMVVDGHVIRLFCHDTRLSGPGSSLPIVLALFDGNPWWKGMTQIGG